MSTDLIVEIADLAWTLTKAELTGELLDDDDIAENMLTIARKAIQAYEEHTGLYIDVGMD